MTVGEKAFLMAERILSSPMPRNRWESWGDDYLEQQVLTYTGDAGDRQAKHGQGSIPWTEIAKALLGRSNKDCRKRWLKIDPRWNGGHRQLDEELRLTEAVMRHGYSCVQDSYYLMFMAFVSNLKLVYR